MARTELKAKTVASLKVTGDRARQDYWDSIVPQFGVRTTSKGARTYILGGRFPGSPHYTRRELAEVGAMSLADARQKAREWIQLLGQGKDPALEEARIARAEAAKLAVTFENVANEFVLWCRGPDEARPRQRRWREVRRQTAILADQWGARPIGDIERDEIVTIIKNKARVAPAESRNLLTVAKSLFAWAREQSYGLRYNVAADIKPSRVIGEKTVRSRVLDEHELRALWAAVGGLGYPVAAVYQMLILTGLRLNEVAQAEWNEVDLDRRLWVIPASRMKGRNGKVRDHVVPLTPKMIGILNSLPRFKTGQFVFSVSFGARPAMISGRVKERIDAQLRLKSPWQNHDIRRGVRSGLAALGIPDPVAESVLAHVRPGIVGTYDRHSYVTERLDALTKWGEFIDPPAPRDGKVTSIAERRRVARS
jgi:integrase